MTANLMFIRVSCAAQFVRAFLSHVHEFDFAVDGGSETGLVSGLESFS
jgi:hypothetical protein